MNLMPENPQPTQVMPQPESPAPASPVYTTICVVAAVIVLTARAIALFM